MVMGKMQKNKSVGALMDRLSFDDCQLYLKLNQNLLVFASQKLDPKSNVRCREDFLELPVEEKFRVRRA